MLSPELAAAVAATAGVLVTLIVMAADKYVVPDAGTYNFALLYVPSDALYLRCFAGSSDLLGAALQRRVVPVGPSGLYLYLHTVGHALRGVRLAAAGLELADTLQRARDEVTALLETDPVYGEPATAARPRPRFPPYRAAQPRRRPGTARRRQRRRARLAMVFVAQYRRRGLGRLPLNGGGKQRWRRCTTRRTWAN